MCEWASIGFFPSMTYDEAKERARTLSANDWDKYQEQRREANKSRLAVEAEEECELLPTVLCQRFEVDILLEQICWNEESAHYRQLLIYWRTAKRVIREIKLAPEEWQDRRTSIYAYFKRRQWSLSYTQKVIRVMNLWGRYYSKINRKFFEPVSKPSGEASVKIHEAFYEKRPQGLVSNPIAWGELQRAKISMERKKWNWLYLTLWFGLRPSELDKLVYKVEMHGSIKLLAVYQHKLTRLPPEQRWKFIPILFQEQREGMKMIILSDFQKPSIPTIRKYVNAGATRRGGRKGFVALMWEAGRYPKALSFRWLGHKSVRTTDNHYTQGMQQACEFEERNAQKFGT